LPNARVTEPNKIRAAITVEIDDESGMPINPPATGLIAELSENYVRLLNRAIAIPERGLHATLAKAGDADMAARPESSEKPGMPINSPTRRDRDIHHAPAAQRPRRIELTGPRRRPHQLPHSCSPSSDAHRFEYEPAYTVRPSGAHAIASIRPITDRFISGLFVVVTGLTSVICVTAIPPAGA
jgi:hypothetical protein